MRQVVLLRGINIGARNRISMPQLRELLTSAGYEDVRTYLQSGNVVLSSDSAPEQLARDCELQISEGLGVDVAMVVRTGEELAEVVRLNPLKKVALEPKRYQVSFCSAEPDAALVRKLAECALSSERLVAAGRELYAWYPEGVGRSRLAAQMSRLGEGIVATARNWTTVTNLLALTEAD